MGRYAKDEWLLEFYDSTRPFAAVDDVLPNAGDVYAWARRNGARDGTPYFVGPDGRADARLNRFWREPLVRSLSDGTQRRYAFALKVWLDFLAAYGVRWDRADPRTLSAFKEWRLSAEEAAEHVVPGSFRTDLAALRRFYEWASLTYPDIENPVRIRVIGVTSWGDKEVALEAAPTGVRRADVKWLTPDAYRLWRDVGLRGFSREGLPQESWEGINEDRDVAFADGLFGTGLRCGELSSLLAVEVPQIGSSGLYRCSLASACAKRRVGRPYWVPLRVAQGIRLYMEEGTRPAAVSGAQRSGRYEAIRGRWLVEDVRENGTLVVCDPDGRLLHVKLDALAPRIRMKLFRQTKGGLEPLWLWLNRDGLPRPKTAWSKVFATANNRVARAMADGRPGAGVRLWARPHMLRHSFALRWYSIATFVSWHRMAGLSAAEQRDMRDQLGDVWFLLASLLGHRSAETTRNIYLEPFQALQVEQLVAIMDADDRAALERLVDTVARGDTRVLSAPL